MGSIATDDPLAKAAGKGKTDNGGTGTAKQAAARTPPAGGKKPRKKAGSRTRQTDGSGNEKSRKKPSGAGKQVAGKPRRKAQSTTMQVARPEKDAQQTGGQEADAAITAAAAMTASAADKPGEDSRSIAWMSAQAVSALKAVKASQARKAESLLARVEKPVPGRPGITELPEQTSEDLLEEIPDMEAAAAAGPGAVTLQETTTSAPAAAGDTPTNQKEATAMQEKPGEVETTAAEAAGETTANAVTEVPASTVVTASPEPEATASTEAVVAAQAQPRGLPARPIVATVFLGLLAFAGYRYWQENRDSFMPSPPVAGGYSETVKDAAWDDIPQQEAIAVVGATPGEQSAPVVTAPGEVTKAPVQPDTTAAEGIATSTATEAHGSPAAEDNGADFTQPAAQAEMETPVTEEATASEPSEPVGMTTGEPSQPQAATVVAPPTRPAQPQPRYGTPGYGYYPQQPNWQQPYYQPARPPQYPAR